MISPWKGDIGKLLDGARVHTTALFGKWLDLLKVELDSLSDRIDSASTPTPVDDTVAGGQIYLFEDGESGSILNVHTAVTENAYESVGPTGSGADNVWDALDDIPSTARILIVAVLLDVNGTGNISISLRARMNGSTSTSANQRIAEMEGTAASSASPRQTSEAFIPMSTSQVFDLFWSVVGESTAVVQLYLKGYVT